MSCSPFVAEFAVQKCACYTRANATRRNDGFAYSLSRCRRPANAVAKGLRYTLTGHHSSWTVCVLVLRLFLLQCNTEFPMQMSPCERLLIEARGARVGVGAMIAHRCRSGGSFVEVPHGKRRLGVWTPG